MTKKRKSIIQKSWCWYCDREFEDEKVLITHQKAKHFKCMYCHKKLNSASGLVIHVAQIHKETINIVPNSVQGHDTPEVEIFGMEGVPAEDIQRHYAGQPIAHYKRIKVAEGGLLPLLAAQKASVPDGPDLPVFAPPAPPVLSSTLATPPPPPTTTMASGPIVTSAPVTNVTPPLSSYHHTSSSPYAAAHSMYPLGSSIPGTQPQQLNQPSPYLITPISPPPGTLPLPPPHQQLLNSTLLSSSLSSTSTSTSTSTSYYPPTSYGVTTVSPQMPLPMSSLPPSTTIMTSVTPVVTTRSFDNIVVPPSIDAAGKLIPGCIIIVPDLNISMEERRSELEKYRFKAEKISA